MVACVIHVIAAECWKCCSQVLGPLCALSLYLFLRLGFPKWQVHQFAHIFLSRAWRSPIRRMNCQEDGCSGSLHTTVRDALATWLPTSCSFQLFPVLLGIPIRRLGHYASASQWCLAALDHGDTFPRRRTLWAYGFLVFWLLYFIQRCQS